MDDNDHKENDDEQQYFVKPEEVNSLNEKLRGPFERIKNVNKLMLKQVNSSSKFSINKFRKRDLFDELEKSIKTGINTTTQEIINLNNTIKSEEGRIIKLRETLNQTSTEDWKPGEYLNYIITTIKNLGIDIPYEQMTTISNQLTDDVDDDSVQNISQYPILSLTTKVQGEIDPNNLKNWENQCFDWLDKHLTVSEQCFYEMIMVAYVGIEYLGKMYQSWYDALFFKKPMQQIEKTIKAIRGGVDNIYDLRALVKHHLIKYADVTEGIIDFYKQIENLKNKDKQDIRKAVLDLRNKIKNMYDINDDYKLSNFKEIRLKEHEYSLPSLFLDK